MAQEPLPQINFAALADALAARAESLVEQWLPGGKIDSDGKNYVVHSVWRSEKTASLKVCVRGSEVGRWADFGGDHRGNDLVSLYAQIEGLAMGKAAAQLARQYGLESVANIVATGPAGAAPAPRVPLPPAPPRQQPDKEKWSVIAPVPADAPETTFWHYARKIDEAQHVARYMRDGVLYGYVVRFPTSDGGKETLPHTWCMSDRDGTRKWHWKVWDAPRPLYLPGGSSPTRFGCTVVLVEGEPKADVLQQLLDAHAPGVYVVVSWQGGCKAWKKADWSWLQGCTVLLWPDCDGKREKLSKEEEAACGGDELALEVAKARKPLLPAHKQVGMAAMLGIGAVLRDEHACQVQLLAVPEPGAVPDGWDCKDAIQTDGWDAERVLAFFATGAALPADGGTPGKKIEGPAGAGSKTPPTGGGGGAGANDDRPWWLEPYWDPEKCKWMVSRKLVITALRHDDALKDVLGLNLLSNNIEARVPWPWAHGRAGPVTGAVDLLLGQYLTDTYKLPSINRAALSEAIETVAHARPFHPVRDYLHSLKHDGVSRIDKWLIHVLGETPDTLSPKLAEYLRQVGRFILLGMVNRVMDPGCKFDYCPVLEGPGGYGKSMFVEVLASSAFFSDTHFDVSRGKEGQEQVQGLWIYEIAEIDKWGKAEIGLIKAFITAKVDRYRPSYGRTVESYARQCLLIGTVNERTYLRDRTGNRRFWPIPVRHRLLIGWLRKFRDQLFAEAMQLYLAGERFTPTPEDEDRLYAPMQARRLVDTAVLSELTHLLTRPPQPTGHASVVNELTDFVTLSQLIQALGVDPAKSNAGLEAQIRGWMDHEGWEHKKRMIAGARNWGYERPKDWPRRLDDDDDMEAPPGEDKPPPAPPSTGGKDDDPI